MQSITTRQLASFVLLAVGCRSAPDTSPGVSWALAEHRAQTISNVRYTLTFDIPPGSDEPIHGALSLQLTLADASHALVLDFTAPDGNVQGVRVANEPVSYEHVNGHLVIAANALAAGENVIAVDFVAGDGALNRNPDFLYTLFVPDRAASVFPAFDQPNIKATYVLTLVLPTFWTSVANGSVVADVVDGSRRTMRFAETRPLSTYVFAFAAGDFTVETAERAGRTLRMFHRETDTSRVNRNREAIFDLHATALTWLEEYTGIPYPFGKLDFVAVPSFQYGGMEHAGAILYRASSLFHDEAATTNQKLSRASLIAHETAHMWFGNLVTMEWFNDVWMKEVFANFMAAKIVNPSFPEIDHDLRFYLAHHASAYGVDRTEGANAIRQELENQLEAGSLYGAIIYQKAPIVMRHLERMMGRDTFRDGLREYLVTHQYSNATWPDLIAILDGRSDRDLRTWSHTWVEEPGRPTITVEHGTEGTGGALRVLQRDPRRRGLVWDQDIEVLIQAESASEVVPVTVDANEQSAAYTIDTQDIAFIVPGVDGVSYGRFVLNPGTRWKLLANFSSIADPIHRAVAWAGLWDALLDGDLEVAAVLDLAIRTVLHEPNELLAQRLLGSISPTFWRRLTPEERYKIAPELETMLWQGVEHAESVSRKAAFFNTYVGIATTTVATERLRQIWQDEADVPGLPLAESNYTRIAQELAVREVDHWETILTTQLERITNPDRRSRFAFVMPALSADSAVRDSVFRSFQEPQSRTHEPWVLSAMSYLNHPLRAASAEHNIYAGLELVEEIQATGDVFFPQRWLDAMLGGHRSRAAAATVRRFLDERPRYPSRLRGKILQAADELFRVAGLARQNG